MSISNLLNRGITLHHLGLCALDFLNAMQFCRTSIILGNCKVQNMHLRLRLAVSVDTYWSKCSDNLSSCKNKCCISGLDMAKVGNNYLIISVCITAFRGLYARHKRKQEKILAFFRLPPTSCQLTTSPRAPDLSARSLPSSSFSTSKPCLFVLLKLSSLPLILRSGGLLCQFSTRQVPATVPMTSKQNSLRSTLIKEWKRRTGNRAMNMRNLSLCWMGKDFLVERRMLQSISES